jgi:hypothetical protein
MKTVFRCRIPVVPVRPFGAAVVSWRPVVLRILALAGIGLSVARGQSPDTPGPEVYDSTILPILRQYCFDCHGDGRDKGGVTLERFGDSTGRLSDV